MLETREPASTFAGPAAIGASRTTTRRATTIVPMSTALTPTADREGSPAPDDLIATGDEGRSDD